jgi:hypothetical protein
MNEPQAHRTINDVMNDIDAYLGLPPAPASPAASPKDTQAAAAAERSAEVLHVMFDVRTKSFVGASIGGKLISGAVAAHLTSDGASLLDAEGENMLGATGAVAGHRSQAAEPEQVAQDIFDWMTGGGDDE